MAFIFYMLQLLYPVQYSAMGLQALVKPMVSFYSSGNTVVALNSEMDYRRAVECLAKSLYWEAKSKTEGEKGMILVGLVILNRVRHNAYPNDICSVVKAKNAFSWYSDGKSDKPREKDRYRLAETIAKQLIKGEHSGKLPSNVLFFKRCDYSSEFFSSLRIYKKHKGHCFYHQQRKR